MTSTPAAYGFSLASVIPPQSMSLLLSHVSQTSLGETCASYVDYITDHLPPSVQKFVLSAKASSPPTWVAEYLRSFDTTTPTTTLLPLAALTLVLSGAILFAIMSSWRDFFRRGPAYSHVANPPLVTEQDYDYIAPASAAHGDTEPDIVLLRHRRHTYELQFPPYAINEGRLSVGQLRRRAAEVTHTADPHRIKLLYKGALLDDDARPCCDEGLKQHSEVLCVVSEVAPGQRTPSEGPSDDTSESVAPPAPLSGDEGEAPRRRIRKRGKKGKKAKKSQNKDGEDEGRLAPPTATAESSRPSSAGGGSSSMPASAPNLKLYATAGEQVQALLSYLRSELTPLCEEYIARPPADAKVRDFEHKKLSETILAQVILKADGIEPASDEERMARRALVKEALTISGRLDQAAKE